MQVLLAVQNPDLTGLVKRSLARFDYEWIEVPSGLDAFQKAITSKVALIIMEFELPRMKAVEILKRFHSLENFRIPPALVLTQHEKERRQIEQEHFQQTEVISLPMAVRTFVDTVQRVLQREIHVACLGGGTGLFTLLSGLKTVPGIALYSIVSMSDDGGSTGKLRDLFGILPPGDVRRSLVALSTAPDLLNELMQYRFERGTGLKGHNLGNLLLTALSEMHGSIPLAVKSLGEILNIQGQVIPVTETVNTLRAELQNGKVVVGEHRIDLFEGRDPKLRITKFWQEPPATANADALEAIHNARYIILGPGDLFTSVISNLIVGGVTEAIVSSKAKKIYVCNVMTKPGETSDFRLADHVREIVKYLKRDALDYVVASTTLFQKVSLEAYAKKGQAPVRDSSDQELKGMTKAAVVRADVASEQELVRHDSLKLAAVLKKIMEGQKNNCFPSAVLYDNRR